MGVLSLVGCRIHYQWGNLLSNFHPVTTPWLKEFVPFHQEARLPPFNYQLHLLGGKGNQFWSNLHLVFAARELLITFTVSCLFNYLREWVTLGKEMETEWNGGCKNQLSHIMWNLTALHKRTLHGDTGAQTHNLENYKDVTKSLHMSRLGKSTFKNRINMGFKYSFLAQTGTATAGH